VHANLKRATWI